MPLKTLYLKSATMRLPRKQKRLSVNMISLPLGDFRHLSHIGLDAHGEAIGDLSALQRTNSLILRSSQSHQDLFQTPAACPSPPPKPPRLLSPEEKEAQAIIKPRIFNQIRTHKKCHSLPLLDTIEVVECPELPERQEQDKQTEQGVKEAGLIMRMEVSELDWAPSHAPCSLVEAPMVDEDSSFALNLDLGPSILDDVLQVMNKLHQ